MRLIDLLKVLPGNIEIILIYDNSIEKHLISQWHYYSDELNGESVGSLYPVDADHLVVVLV